MRHIINHQGYKDLCKQLGVSESEAEGLIASLLAGFVPTAHPSFHQMVGIPGAGKTTYVGKLDLKNVVILGCDDTMEKLQGYQRDKQALGNKEAFLKWEVCARALTYEALFRAVDMRLNVLLDFNSADQMYIDMLKFLKEGEGYHISVSALLIDEGAALERIRTRDRYVPAEYVSERKQIIEGLLPAYRAVADKYTEIISVHQSQQPVQKINRPKGPKP